MAAEKYFGGRFCWFGNISKFIGQRLGLEESRRARLEGLWSPRDSSGPLSKHHGCLLVQEKSSWKFYSVWTPYDIPFSVELKNKEKTETGTGL